MTPHRHPDVEQQQAGRVGRPDLVAGLQGASGSTIGPGGALFVTEGATGRILRVDPRTGQVTVFASGLPPSLIGLGSAIDVAFVGSTAYALVTLVGFDVGGSSTVGIYRVDGPNTFLLPPIMTVVIDGPRHPRGQITGRRFSSNAEADRHDAEFWRQLPPHQRVLIAWQLSLEQWDLLGRAPHEPRLHRSVASVRRR